MLQARSVGRPVAPGRRVAAAAVWAVSWGLAVGSLAMAAFGGADPDALPFDVHSEFFVPDLLIGIIYAPLAAILISGSRHPAGGVVAVISVGFAVTAFAIQYAVLGSEVALPAYSFVVHLVTWAWSAGAFLCVLVLPWILDSDMDRRARLAARLGLALTVFACATRSLTQIDGAPPSALSPSARVSELAAQVDAWALVLYAAYGLLGAAHLARRFRRSGADERRGLAWVASSVVLVSLAYVAFETGLDLGGVVLGVAAGALFAGLVMLPAAVFVLILGQPDGRLDGAVSRTTVWGLLTALVAGGYVTLVWVAGRVFPEDSQLSAAVAAAVLALALVPVQRWVQGRVDRLVYGSGADPQVLLSRLAGDVAGEASSDVPAPAGLAGLVEGLRRSTRLRHVAVRSAPGRPAVSATAGEPAEHALQIDLERGGKHLGWMDVGARHGERLDPRTVRLLEQIAGLVAVSLELAQVNEELETARSRMLGIRHEERRLLRRELHDGLGPALAGSSLALAAIANNSPGMSARDADLLRSLRAELDRRADDVRDMARAMLPPALDDGRLHDALVVLAERFTDDRFAVEIDAQGADLVDSTRQVAIYHVAAEAVFNAHRHSGAARCRVRLEPCGGGVRLSVHDDGSGISPEASEGIGLASMRERAIELGGAFDLAEGADGTTVTVEFP